MQAFREKNLATYHKWVWELKRLYRSPLISTILKSLELGSQSESDLTRKALSTPAYLRTLIRYTPYIWKQIIDISTITTIQYWWLSDNGVHCLPICLVMLSSPTAMILWPFPAEPTVHVHRSMQKSNQYPKQLRSGVVMEEFNCLTFLSYATVQNVEQQ